MTLRISGWLAICVSVMSVTGCGGTASPSDAGGEDGGPTDSDGGGPTPTCDDGVMNGVETDVDCGGPCDPCGPGSACSGGEDCASGVCIAGVCGENTCGDGVAAGGEECDDGAESASCDADCTAAACGDAVVNAAAGESCDEGAASATCDADCTAPMCGDGVVNTAAAEECDDSAESAACDADCTAASCGDSTINATAGEACDDGAESAACDADCTAASCGDSTVNATALEECDDGAESATCDADCTAASCGDSTVNATALEECDDGAESATCDADCTAASCGDGTINATAAEECDDMNTVDDDLCSNACVSTTCSDGARNADETDVDCGGRCGATCAGGATCASDADCRGSGTCDATTMRCRPTSIVIAALPSAHTGSLGGLAGADAMCAAAATAASRTGVWVALLSAVGPPARDYATVIPAALRTGIPVRNIIGEQLTADWMALLALGEFGTTMANVYTLTGVIVEEGTGTPVDWSDADGWTGTLPNGLVDAPNTCSDWTATTGSGRNTELDFRYMLRQELQPCTRNHAVMCVRISD